MDRTGAPSFLWFFCMLYIVSLMNFTAVESLRWITPYQATFGTMPNISSLLQFTFFQLIYYSKDNSFPASQEKLGHWLGVTKNMGDTLTYWILADNNEILARLLVQPVEDGEVNKCVETLQRDLSLDLLSDCMINEQPIKDDTLDLSRVNGVTSSNDQFDPNNHIELQFIQTDKNNVPTRTEVVEVDKDTGKVMLEYIHGGLEMVDPNVIQEALLAKEHHKDGDTLWVFNKILNHQTINHGRVKVEVLWDNGETSW